MSKYIFRATEISGLRDPTYSSGAASKHYVDTHTGGTNANGISTISDGSGSILHTLSDIPDYWNVRPSGNVNYGITTRVDSTKIYVSLTAGGTRDVYWYAST